ncbi:MAG: hypothetical protein ABIP16_04710 [Thermomonas sp.]
MSIILAFVFALIAKGRGQGPAIVIGGVFGLIVYVVNFYGMTAMFPWFEMARGWISIFAHLMYGAVLGGVYASFATKYNSQPVTR